MRFDTGVWCRNWGPILGSDTQIWQCDLIMRLRSDPKIWYWCLMLRLGTEALMRPLIGLRFDTAILRWDLVLRSDAEIWYSDLLPRVRSKLGSDTEIWCADLVLRSHTEVWYCVRCKIRCWTMLLRWYAPLVTPEAKNLPENCRKLAVIAKSSRFWKKGSIFPLFLLIFQQTKFMLRAPEII